MAKLSVGACLSYLHVWDQHGNCHSFNVLPVGDTLFSEEADALVGGLGLVRVGDWRCAYRGAASDTEMGDFEAELRKITEEGR